MPTVAAYADVRDGETRLTAFDPVQNIAIFPANGALNTPRPILTFRLNPAVPGADLNLKLKLNGHTVFDQDFGSEQLRAMTEVIDEGILRSGDNLLTAELSAEGGAPGPLPSDAAMTISDVSCLYSVNV